MRDYWQTECAETESPYTRQEHLHLAELGLAPAWTMGKAKPMPFVWKLLFADTKWIQQNKDKHIAKFRRVATLSAKPDVFIELARDAGGSESVLLRRFICRHPHAPPDICTHALFGFVGSAGRKFTLLGQFGYALRKSASPAGEQNPYNPSHNRTEFVKFVANLHGAYDTEVPCTAAESPEWMERLNAALGLPINDVPFADEPWLRTPRDLMAHLACDGNRFVRWAAQTRLANPAFVWQWPDE